MNNRILVRIISLTILVNFLPLNTWAALGSTIVERSPGALHQAQVAEDWSNFEGSLACPPGDHNDGQACSLRFKDRKTGQMYGIVGDNQDAMRLYLAGRTQVSIEGRVDGDQVVINAVRPL